MLPPKSLYPTPRMSKTNLAGEHPQCSTSLNWLLPLSKGRGPEAASLGFVSFAKLHTTYARIGDLDALSLRFVGSFSRSIYQLNSERKEHAAWKASLLNTCVSSSLALRGVCASQQRASSPVVQHFGQTQLQNQRDVQLVPGTPTMIGCALPQIRNPLEQMSETRSIKPNSQGVLARANIQGTRDTRVHGSRHITEISISVRRGPEPYTCLGGAASSPDT